MIHLLRLYGIAYRIRRQRRLLREGRLRELRRVLAATERDLNRLRP